MTGIKENEVGANEDDLYDAKSENPDEPAGIATVAGLFDVEVLHVIKEAQLQHGLRHGDYQRYHAYCSRRLKRIRKVLKFKMGEKRKVTPKKVTETIFSDARYVLMLLMASERAWSMAMQFKQEAQSNPRKRHHMVEKLRKAVIHANELNNLCENSTKVNARTKLESQAYCSYITGVLKFEVKDWVAARDLFTKTQTIYGKLCETLPKDEQPVYKNMVDEIAPNIRYCAYTIGDQSAIDDLVHLHGSGRQDPLLAGKLDSLIAETRQRKASSMSEVVWRNRHITIKNSKVRVFLIGIKEFDKELAEIAEEDRDARIELYDGVLTECKDALLITREDIKADPHSKSANKTDKVSDLQFLHSYLTHIRLTKTIQRNLLLVEDLKSKSGKMNEGGGGDKKSVRPSDFIRLYDVILHNLGEMTSLPGLEHDVELRDEVDARLLTYRAFRCFHAAQTMVHDKRWTEAIALYERVLQHARGAIDAGDAADTAPLEELIETIAFNRYRVHAAAVLHHTTQHDAAAPPDDRRPLTERLDTYRELAHVSGGEVLTRSFPPQFSPVPCKPLFFDLALNHATFPALEHKTGQRHAGGQKQGLTGLLSNLWGGWGSKK